MHSKGITSESERRVLKKRLLVECRGEAVTKCNGLIMVAAGGIREWAK